MDVPELLAVGAIAFVGVLMVLLTRRLRAGRPVSLRPLKGYADFSHQIGRAVESGRRIHFSLGRASLAGAASPTSVAAILALDYLAISATANGVPPLVTVGEGTLLPAAQDSLRHGFARANRLPGFSLADAQFIAPETFPMTYAAGVTSVIHQDNISSNLMMGRFGSELAIMAEAGARAEIDQLVASDDPVSLALGTAVSDNVLIGEELFASGAYLFGRPAQIASLQVQDFLRLVAIAIILALALFQFALGWL